MAQPTWPVGQVVRAPKTAELIAAHIRRQIVRGDLREGDTLPSEAVLMSQFAVSRPTLREAFRILETESLISIRRGSRGGAQVMAPHLSVAARYVGLLLQLQGTTIADVYQARLVVEPVCARLLAERRTEEDLTDLRAGIAQLRAVVESAPGGIPRADHWTTVISAFRDLLMQRSGNRTLAVQGGVLQDIVATHLTMTVARGVGDEDVARANFRRTIGSHAKLLTLVEARDGDRAEAHWRTHMEVAAKSLLRDDLRSTSVVDLFS
ncbi:MAG: regulatory protein GntR [Blastococcus sp.]|jgi:GntR family transcriptional repressor for pyruvate dehydrogenase complex|nr:regulatory protein GntR [Blastococcus sp.]